jgi:hypothetical protein
MGRNQRDEVLVVSNTHSSNFSSTHLAGNGSNTVTISSVAPEGVGTATISKWLQIIDISTGTKYFIPCWT